MFIACAPETCPRPTPKVPEQAAQAQAMSGTPPQGLTETELRAASETTSSVAEKSAEDLTQSSVLYSETLQAYRTAGEELGRRIAGWEKRTTTTGHTPSEGTAAGTYSEAAADTWRTDVNALTPSSAVNHPLPPVQKEPIAADAPPEASKKLPASSRIPPAGGVRPVGLGKTEQSALDRNTLSAEIVEVETEVVTLGFQFDSDQLTDEARRALRQATITFARAQSLRVNGFTCSSGSPVYNQYLALRRATRVARELMSVGIPHALISTSGKGSCCYISSNDTPHDRAKNRRVEVVAEIPTRVARARSQYRPAQAREQHAFAQGADTGFAEASDR